MEPEANAWPGVQMEGVVYLLSLACILCFSSRSYASPGTDGASFLNIPVGAGPASLGAAYTALATDAYAPIWNPAGLARLSGNEASAQHLAYLESMNYESLSFVHPLGPRDAPTHRGVGFSVQYLGAGDITRTDIDAGGNPTTTNPGDRFSSHFASYNASYGQTLTEKLAVGLTGKWIDAKVDNVGARAYAADVGALYSANEAIRFGASLVNVGTRLKFISDGDSLPAAFKLGAAWRSDSHYIVSAEGVYEKSGLASYHVGAEWRPTGLVSLRAGYRTDTLKGLNAMAGFSTGLGLHLCGQEFAYAWTPYGDLGDTQYFSLRVRFGASEEARHNLIQYQALQSDRAPRKKSVSPEPEYQQLMQLLSETEAPLAQAVHIE
jgi:hypothetical protein